MTAGSSTMFEMGPNSDLLIPYLRYSGVGVVWHAKIGYSSIPEIPSSPMVREGQLGWNKFPYRSYAGIGFFIQ